MDVPRLRFQFLGNFAIFATSGWHPGPPPKKGRDLIQYLGAYPRRVATTEALAEAFWPDEDASALAHRMHLAASGARTYLRAVLGGGNAIAHVAGGYAWNAGMQLSSDVDDFLALAKSETARDLEAAAALYGGEFLAGEAADWVQPLRVRCASAYSNAVYRLAGRALADRNETAALAFGLQLVEAEPGHEGATRLVMRCFAELGQRARALECYAKLEAYLERHLGIGPTRETRALAAGLAREADSAETA